MVRLASAVKRGTNAQGRWLINAILSVNTFDVASSFSPGANVEAERSICNSLSPAERGFGLSGALSWGQLFYPTYCLHIQSAVLYYSEP